MYANGVDSTTKEATVVNIDSNGNNYILSSAVIANAGGLDGKNTVDNVTTGMDVVSALYAEKGAEINLSAIIIYILIIAILVMNIHLKGLFGHMILPI